MPRGVAAHSPGLRAHPQLERVLVVLDGREAAQGTPVRQALDGVLGSPHLLLYQYPLLQVPVAGHVSVEPLRVPELERGLLPVQVGLPVLDHLDALSPGLPRRLEHHVLGPRGHVRLRLYVGHRLRVAPVRPEEQPAGYPVRPLDPAHGGLGHLERRQIPLGAHDRDAQFL